MNDDTAKQWIVMHCLDAFKDADGKEGQHKIPPVGYDAPMTKATALEALAKIEQARPDEDFSIRRLGDILPFNNQ